MAEVLTACRYCECTRQSLWRSEIRDRLNHVRGSWSFVRCMSCASTQLQPLPSADEIAGYYPPIYGYEPAIQAGHGWRGLLASLPERLFYAPFRDAQTRLILKGIRLRQAQGQHLLDVGCGRGLRLPAFQKLGASVVGMDFTPTYLQALAAMGIPAFCSDFEHLEEHVEPESFDIITAFHVLEHVLEPRQALKACGRLLRPGGWLVVAVPLADSVQAQLLGKRWIGVTEAPRHITLPSQPGLRLLLESTGYDVVRFYPDAMLNCAGMMVLSILPGAALTNRAHGGVLNLALSGLSAPSTFAAIPLAVAEGYFAYRPGAGIFFARKRSESC